METPAPEPQPVQTPVDAEAPAVDLIESAETSSRVVEAVVEPELTEEELEQAREIAQYDLTPKIAEFLDAHLLIPILSHLFQLGAHKKRSISQAEIFALAETGMVDFRLEKFLSLDQEPDFSVDEERDRVLESLTTTRDKFLHLLEVLEQFEDKIVVAGMRSLEEFCIRYEVTPESIDGMIEFSKLQYDVGNYAVSSELLKHYKDIISIATEDEKPSSAKECQCYWGLLASCIFEAKWDEAMFCVTWLDKQADERAERAKQAAQPAQQPSEFIPAATWSQREILLHRTWLLHWMLFPLFKKDSGDGSRAEMDAQILEDIFLSQKMLSIISLSCPHLFRYVGACLILNKRVKHAMLMETMWILVNESASYSDPVTRFLMALYTDIHFEEAQHELKRCEALFKGDYFLCSHWPDFLENARLQIFETYCRIHQSINIGMVASTLNMVPEEAERWIVNLIKSAKLDARIDSEKNCVVMSKVPPSVYQQVIEKTQNLSLRSVLIFSNLERRD